MKHLLFLPALVFLTSCAAFKKEPLPAREKPTRTVNRNFSVNKVRYYETYKLGRQSKYLVPNYRIAFVHMKDGGAYPIPCMPFDESMTPTLSPTVYANRKNDAWTVYTYLPRKKDRVYEFTQADLIRVDDDLYLGGKKLEQTANLPLKD